LARTAFIIGYYDDSKRFFQELETGIGLGHRLRSRSRFPILDNAGSIKDFEGTVLNIFSPYEGAINCGSLRELRYPIGFRPIACAFEPSMGELVKFNIAFTFRNPYAINVRRV